MASDSIVDKLAEAVLYEGFILYPYRPSAKNRQRWTFGGLYPREFCERQKSVEAPQLQVQCLIVGDDQTRVEITLHFLRVIDRKIGKLTRPLSAWPSDGVPDFETVAGYQVGDRQFHSWQEAAEQKLAVDSRTLAELAQPYCQLFVLPGNVVREPIVDGGEYVGLIERAQHPLTGSVELCANRIAEGCFRLTVRAANETPPQPNGGRCPSDEARAPLDRDAASLHAFAAAHVVIRVIGGVFVSQIDPPEHVRQLAEENQNVGVWPVLIGEVPDRTTMLAAPIILGDYPQIAPESPTGLFDSTEIDEMLTLRIMTLTDAEKQAMRAVDPRSRDLLDRVESLGAGDLLRLHGAIRNPGSFQAAAGPFDPWQTTPEQAMQSVFAHGVLLTPGDRVRLTPRAGADIFDVVLAGKTATIHSIEHDFEGLVHLAVTIDDDPGRDLGEQRQAGHRFFYRLDEVEPLAGAAESER